MLDSEPPSRPRAAGDAASASTVRPDGGATILVVDDEASARTALSRILTGRGHRMIACSGGEEALAVLEREAVDLAILDLVMPGMDGLEVCRRIREVFDAPGLPVIFMTGHESEEHRIRGLEAGADEFLAKPVAPTELLVRVRNLVRVRRYHQEVVCQRNDLERAVRARTEHLERALVRVEAAEAHLRETHHETVRRMATIVEFRSPETAHHLERMSRYAALLAREAGLSPERCDDIRLAASMHDIGKIVIPDRILLKPGPLTAEEFEVVKQHAEIGYRILSGSEVPLTQLAATIAWTHHERWDGKGYPRGLVSEETPLEGRICAIADVFDALTGERVYKDAFSVDRSAAILRDGAGTQFDPTLVPLFLGALDEILGIMDEWADEAPFRERLPTEGT